MARVREQVANRIANGRLTTEVRPDRPDLSCYNISEAFSKSERAFSLTVFSSIYGCLIQTGLYQAVQKHFLLCDPAVPGGGRKISGASETFDIMDQKTCDKGVACCHGIDGFHKTGRLFIESIVCHQ